MGMPGASLSFGPAGIYSNLGIPGTGLSQRTKLGGAGRSSKSFVKGSPSKPSQKPVQTYDFSTINLKVEDDGTITFSDREGNAVDEEIIRSYKRTPLYQLKIQEISEDYHRTILEETKKFVDIFRNAPPLKNEEQWLKEIDQLNALLQAAQDVIPIFKSSPSREACVEELEQKAEKDISSLFFWRNRSLREEYVKSNISEYYSSKLLEWKKEKADFEEECVKKKQDLQNQKQYIEDIIKDFVLTGDEQYIFATIDDTLEDIRLPVDFMVDYSFSPPDTVDVDLDLPEIEDLNTKSSRIPVSSEITVKEKSQRELNQDYARCVCGLAFFIAGNLFNVSPKILKVNISGYTQRLIERTGSFDDDYIFSIKIDRVGYSGINFALADPIEAVSSFKNVMDITSDFEMSPITPY